MCHILICREVCSSYINIGGNGSPERALPPLSSMKLGYIGSSKYDHLHTPYRIPPALLDLTLPPSPVFSDTSSPAPQSASMARSSSMTLPEKDHYDVSPRRRFTSLPGIPRPQRPSPPQRPVGPPSVAPGNNWQAVTELSPDGELRVSGVRDSSGRIIRHSESFSRLWGDQSAHV